MGPAPAMHRRDESRAFLTPDPWGVKDVAVVRTRRERPGACSGPSRVIVLPYSSSVYALSRRLRVGWRSLRSAFASIWRMRSRVTLKNAPTSSSVR